MKKKFKIIQITLNILLLAVMFLPSLTFSAQGDSLFNVQNGNSFSQGFGYDDPASGGTLSNVGSNGYVSSSQPRTNAVSCPKRFGEISGIIDYVTCTIGGSVIPLLFSIALAVFFYGVVKYVIAGDGTDSREEGRWFMIYGVVGLFVMVSVWGLVAVISNTFTIGTSFPPQF